MFNTEDVRANRLTGTMRVTAARVESGTPASYRLARKPDGELILQGAFQWSEGCNNGIEWRDIPTLILE